MAAYRYRPFGLFRLVLAIMVVVQHFVANTLPIDGFYRAVLPYEVGTLAVYGFFCLSGFVIAEAAVEVYAGKPVAYLANRLLRIVPHFLVALLIAVIVHRVFRDLGTLRIADREHPGFIGEAAFGWRNLLANILGFLPGANHLMSYDFVGIIWAVRIEMVFYVAVFCFLLCPWRQRLQACAPLLLVGLGLATVAVAQQFGLFFFFTYGVFLLDRRRQWRNLLMSLAGMGLYFALLPTRLHDYDRAVGAQVALLAAMIAMMTWLAFRRSWRQSLDRRCGDLSYPLYVHHENVMVLLISLTPGYHYSVFFLGIILGIAYSYGLMRLVDPMVTRLRDAVRGRRLEPARRLPRQPIAKPTRPAATPARRP